MRRVHGWQARLARAGRVFAWGLVLPFAVVVFAVVVLVSALGGDFDAGDDC